MFCPILFLIMVKMCLAKVRGSKDLSISKGARLEVLLITYIEAVEFK